MVLVTICSQSLIEECELVGKTLQELKSVVSDFTGVPMSRQLLEGLPLAESQHVTLESLFPDGFAFLNVIDAGFEIAPSLSPSPPSTTTLPPSSASPPVSGIARSQEAEYQRALRGGTLSSIGNGWEAQSSSLVPQHSDFYSQTTEGQLITFLRFVIMQEWTSSLIISSSLPLRRGASQEIPIHFVSEPIHALITRSERQRKPILAFPANPNCDSTQAFSL